MKPLSTLILTAALFFVSCHGGPSTIALTTSSMYSIDTVRLADAGGDANAASRKLQEAIDLYRKKGADTARAIELFKSSILLQPTAKAYFELAGALLSTRRFDEGLKALSMAEGLGYSPMANVMFRYAYAYANKPDDTGSLPNSGHVVHYMQLAIQMGYAHPGQFLQKNLFPGAARKSDYDIVFANVLSGGSMRDPSKSLWDAYEGQFPQIGLPLVVDIPWIQQHKLEDVIDFQYEKFIPDMRDAKFSRESSTTFYYIAEVHKEKAFVAVLYGEAYESAEGDGSELPQYTLVTYDRQGKLIDKMAVAGRTILSDPFLVFSIQPDLKFRVQGFKDVYKDNPDSVGYENNPIIRRDSAPAKYYQIAS
ncbi:MAG TPA: hypothetical protein VGQ51_06810, partial [Puia sp.]|nr:hypothetical protein [Puia sp.]